jgi:hypothetical protein
MPEPVIANTSPLFYLHRLGLLEILPKLYGSIMIPEAVARELEKGASQGEDTPRLRSYSWIEIVRIETPEYLKLVVDLGAGESEVLALATKYPSSLVILDDRLARRIADMKQFRMTGTVGVLLRARKRNLIPELKPVIENLLSLNFRLKPELVKTVLEVAGER